MNDIHVIYRMQLNAVSFMNTQHLLNSFLFLIYFFVLYIKFCIFLRILSRVLTMHANEIVTRLAKLCTNVAKKMLEPKILYFNVLRYQIFNPFVYKFCTVILKLFSVPQKALLFIRCILLVILTTNHHKIS
jgi:hypothetical protein